MAKQKTIVKFEIERDTTCMNSLIKTMSLHMENHGVIIVTKSDIAMVEHMHDLLLEKGLLDHDNGTLVKARNFVKNMSDSMEG